MIVQTFKFMPFASRAGQSVIGLRFPFNEALTAALKASLARHKGAAIDPARQVNAPGGWQPKSRCWFVEEAIWPAVLADLRAVMDVRVVEAQTGAQVEGLLVHR